MMESVTKTEGETRNKSCNSSDLLGNVDGYPSTGINALTLCCLKGCGQLCCISIHEMRYTSPLFWYIYSGVSEYPTPSTNSTTCKSGSCAS